MKSPLLYLIFALIGATAFAAGSATKPNVLFIAINAQNDWVRPLGGHPLAKIPNLDRLARRGCGWSRKPGNQEGMGRDYKRIAEEFKSQKRISLKKADPLVGFSYGLPASEFIRFSVAALNLTIFMAS